MPQPETLRSTLGWHLQDRPLLRATSGFTVLSTNRTSSSDMNYIPASLYAAVVMSTGRFQEVRVPVLVLALSSGTGYFPVPERVCLPLLLCKRREEHSLTSVSFSFDILKSYNLDSCDVWAKTADEAMKPSTVCSKVCCVKSTEWESESWVLDWFCHFSPLGFCVLIYRGWPRPSPRSP